MNKKSSLCWLVFSLFVLTAFLLIPGLSVAKESYQSVFDEFYGFNGSEAGDCSVCHTQGERVNAYGKDFQAKYKQMKKKMKASKESLIVEALKSIESADSDKDGYSNLEELQAGANPGDIRVKPMVASSDQGDVTGSAPTGSKALPQVAETQATDREDHTVCNRGKKKEKRARHGKDD